jgi:hypothetical protein
MGDLGGLETYRWTLSEYVLRVELGADVREVVVEGVVDRDLIDRALRDWKCEAAVLEADFLAVEKEEIEAAGHRGGVKGKLLTLAQALSESPVIAELVRRIAVVVDRDYDPDPPSNPILLCTDGFAIENYALDPGALQRFVEQVLGRAPRSAGAGGAGPGRRSCTGADLYGCLHDGLVEIASVRLALHGAEPPTKPFTRWIDYIAVDGTGRATADGASLLKNVLTTSGRVAELERLEADRLGQCERIRSDPRRWVRGHDFLAVLKKILDSTWGRSRNGRVATSGDLTQLSRFLLFSVDPEELHSSHLFSALRERFSTA